MVFLQEYHAVDDTAQAQEEQAQLERLKIVTKTSAYCDDCECRSNIYVYPRSVVSRHPSASYALYHSLTNLKILLMLQHLASDRMLSRQR